MSETRGKINPIELDMSLDDIKDIPAFTSFPTGAYTVVLEKGIELVDVNEHPALACPLTLKEVHECDTNKLDVGEEPPKPGDIATLTYMRDNEFGVGNFKRDFKKVAEQLNARTVQDIIDGTKGIECMVIIKRRHGKKGTDKEDNNYMQVVNLAMI